MNENNVTIKSEESLSLMDLVSLKLDFLKCPAWESFDESSNEDLAKQITCEIEKKTDAYIMVMVNLDSEAEQLDTIIKACQSRKNAIKNNKERLKDILAIAMKSLGVENLKGKIPKFGASFRKPSQKVEITNPEMIPPEYIDMVPTIRKVDVSNALKSGKEVSGASLIEGKQTLTIRSGK